MRDSIIILPLLCASSTAFRGVHPGDVSKYRRGSELHCPAPDKPTRLHADQINNEYCDCPLTGFDEPGTSACSKGQFWCPNIGHVGKFIPNTYVDDGHCDCCDGADEKAGRCANTCERERATHLEQEQTRRATLKLALKAKRDLEEAGEKFKTKTRQRIAELGTLLSMEQVLLNKSSPPANESAPSTNARLDERLRYLERLMLILREQNDLATVLVAFNAYLEKFSIDTNPEPESSKDAGEHAAYDDDDVVEEEILGEFENEKDPSEEANSKGGDKDESAMEKLKSRFNNLWKVLRARTTETITKYLVSEPTNSPTEHEEYEATFKSFQIETKQRISNYQAELRDLEKKAALEIPDVAFAGLDGQCYSSVLGDATYDICPFNNVTQRTLQAGTHSLGKWSGWGNGHMGTEMEYTDGGYCWQGPHRSTLVKVQCGAINQITSVMEPTACRYIMKFTTPAACQADTE